MRHYFDWKVFKGCFERIVDSQVATFSTVIFRTLCKKAKSQICTGYNKTFEFFNLRKQIL